MHHSRLTSTRAFRASTAVLVFLTLASAAACRDDVTSPKATSPVAVGTPQAAVIPPQSTTLTVRIETIQGFLAVEGLSIKVFLDGSSTQTVTVLDNAPADKDSVFGQFRFVVPAKASYRVCAQGSTSSLVADGFADACKTVTGARGSVDVGAVIAHRRPFVGFSLRSTSGAVITGATVGWTTASGTQQKDSDTHDVGRIVSMLPAAGTAVYCEIKAPKGYQLITPQCVAMEVEWDTVHSRILTHAPLPKVQLP